ncbi:MAG: haloacid dehalogenase-like hydrolase [Candidatus Wallbacteria bacterium]|nr:haloacid dehalogenase-like hydrolase [Candidatus Wallbacteria bacterium]
MSRLLLFDIDGTLINTDGAGRHALELSFMECTGRDISPIDYPLCGKTDLMIINELLGILGLEAGETLIEDIIEAYTLILPYELKIAENPMVLPGVSELLQLLKKRSDCRLGLLTGNVQAGAQIKLDFFQLADFFETGGFGDDAVLRSDIFPFAFNRCCRKFRCEFSKDDIFLIGDAPGDISCARDNGVKIICVETGGTPREVLSGMNPDHLLTDLTDDGEFMGIIFTGTGS